MIVYGHSEFTGTCSSLLERLRWRLAKTRPDDLEDLRVLVIQTGQLEQGVADHLPQRSREEEQTIARITRLTDCAAAAFYNAWVKASGTTAPHIGTDNILWRMARDLEALHPREDHALTINIPEGFEFYALFPEQYCASAIRWAAHHTGMARKSAVVVGIRSIGTTLSALVTAALQAHGWRVRRLTVRPTGHAFARHVELGQVDLAGAGCALVVDEGPGLSGSSMAATAQALARAGTAGIFFFPGHGGEPGSAASPEVRHWWAATPRYWTPLEDLRWNGLSLAESLASHARELRAETEASNAGPRDHIEDLSAGLWRRRVFANESDWPAATTQFERMKFRCSVHSGPGVLWKFAGFGCGWEGGQTSTESSLEQMTARAKEGFVPVPLGAFRGFITLPWMEGNRLTRLDSTNAPFLRQTGLYLLRSAGPSLSAAESASAISRLADMLFWNTKEALGDRLAERSRLWAEAGRAAEPALTYGDGRMAPHEWVRTPAGKIWKIDSVGHDRDHTIVGRQSVLWDVAGVLVEWDLKPAPARLLFHSLREAGLRWERDTLAFYQMAYAGFRLGLTSLCADQTVADSAEQARLRGAAAYYRRTLERLLKTAAARGHRRSD